MQNIDFDQNFHIPINEDCSCEHRIGSKPWMFLGIGLPMLKDSNLVDPASSHMLVSKIKPCMSKYK